MNDTLTFGKLNALREASLPDARAGARHAVVVIAEAASEQTPDYAFRSLNAPGGGYEVPEAFTHQILHWTHRLYDSHGLAEFIVDTVATLVLGGGLQYNLSFEKGFPVQYEKAIRDRVKEWWYHEDIAFEDRAHMFLLDALVEGETGWRFEVNRATGFVRIASFFRNDVAEIEVDEFDPLTLRAVVLNADGQEKKKETLQVLRKDTATKRLSGDCLYYRRKFRGTSRRGKPVLQAVVDELRSEKQFRILGVDRALARLSIFMDTELTGMNEDQVEQFAKEAGTTLPTHGRRLYHNESVKNDFISAKIEAGDLTEMMKFLVSVVMMAMGFPPSWAGIGEGTNRSIAETQQDPAIRNRKREKDMLLRFFERTVDFVIDSAIEAYIARELGPGQKLIKVLDETGAPVERPLRECVTVTVSTIPIENTNREAPPMQATKAALDVLALADEMSERHGSSLYDDSQRATVLNWAHKRDGIDVELAPEMKTASDAGTGAQPGSA